MVECASDADCHRLCGRHPLTSSHYSCQKRFKLFDYANISSDKAVDYITSTVAAGNVSDPREGMGICVDSNALLYQSCHNEQLANVVDVVVGCADRMIARFLCGLEVKTRRRSDYGDPARQPLLPARSRGRLRGHRGRRRPGAPRGVQRPVDCSTRCVPRAHVVQRRRSRQRARSGIFRVKPCPATARLLTPLSALCATTPATSTIDALYWAVYEDVLTAIASPSNASASPKAASSSVLPFAFASSSRSSHEWRKHQARPRGKQGAPVRRRRPV